MATATTTTRPTREMSRLSMRGLAGVERGANRAQLTDAEGNPVDGWHTIKSDGTPVEATVTATDTTTVEQRAEKAEADLAAANAELETLRAEKAAAPAPEPGTPEFVAKAMESLDPTARAYFAQVAKDAEATAKRAEETEKVAKAERDLRIDGEWVNVAKADLPNLVDADGFAPVLRAAWDHFTPEQFTELYRVLRSADAVAAKSEVFRTIGGSGSATGTAWEQITKAADEMVAADTTGNLTREAAIDRVGQTNPTLKAEYDKERAQR